jgi:formyltetrahydrofolate hydrolase
VGYNLRLLISCPDKKGLIAAISSFISMHDGNILSADQYVGEGKSGGTFFMRLEIHGGDFGLQRDEFRGHWRRSPASMRWTGACHTRTPGSAWPSWSPATITASRICSGAGTRGS